MTYREMYSCLTMLDQADGRYVLMTAMSNVTSEWPSWDMSRADWTVRVSDAMTWRSRFQGGPIIICSSARYRNRAAFLSDWPHLHLNHEWDQTIDDDTDEDGERHEPGALTWGQILWAVRELPCLFPRWQLLYAATHVPLIPYHLMLITPERQLLCVRTEKELDAVLRER